MSQQATTTPNRGLRATLVIYVLGPLLLLFIVAGLLFFQKGTIGPGDEKKDKLEDENQLALARAALGKQADLATCRGAIQQLNAHLQLPANRDKIQQELKPLDEAREVIKQELKLPDDDFNEVASPTFTTLDAHHLEACFLLRDVARSLDLAGPAARRKPDEKAQAVQLAPLKRAELAFDWVMRQVQLMAPLPGQEPDDVPTPPAFVLRRGSGTAFERALVFLALLEQFSLDDEKSGLQGVLIVCPNADGEKRFWACGVTIGGQPGAVYLFDPRLGLPLPGPDGKGVATLTEAANKPAVLAQLQADAPAPAKPKDDKAKDDKAKGDKAKTEKPKPERLTYDVTADQAKKAELFLATPLSAFAPRMELLQDKLLRDPEVGGQVMPAAIRVRLAESAKATRARLEKLIGGKPRFLPQAVTRLRRFLPKEEGGNDPGVRFTVAQLPGFSDPRDTSGGEIPRSRLYELQAVPWQDFPEMFRNPRDLPFNVGLGLHLRDRFMAPFIRPLRDPSSPRMQMLRGRLGPTSSAPSQLNVERDAWRDAAARADQQRETLPGQVSQWLAKTAIPAYAAVLRENPRIDDASLRARVANVWGAAGGAPIELFMAGAIAVPREAQSLFQLALFKHEQAVRQQVRLDLGRADGDERKAARAWEQAADYWRDYVEGHAQQPGIVGARRLLAEALARAGHVEEARLALRETSRMDNLEKLAHLWLASRLEPKGK